MMHIFLAALSIALSSSACGTPADRAGITAAILAHQPKDTKVGSIEVAGNYANATAIWHGGDAAGSVLLMKQNGGWKILFSQGGVNDQNAMEKYGHIPAASAAKLWKIIESGACEKH